MPETALGLFPDIGASYFLSRLPRFFGNTTYILNYSYRFPYLIFKMKILNFEFLENQD